MGSTTLLKTASWYKDGVKRQSVLFPDLRDPDGFVGPLVLSNIGVRDGGNYSCLLEVLLRNKKKYHVSDTTVISSKLAYPFLYSLQPRCDKTSALYILLLLLLLLLFFKLVCLCSSLMVECCYNLVM